MGLSKLSMYYPYVHVLVLYLVKQYNFPTMTTALIVATLFLLAVPTIKCDSNSGNLRKITFYFSLLN